MSINSSFQFLSKENLFKRLSCGKSATTVVTPNRRLAKALHDQINQYHVNQQKSVWLTVDILPFVSFLERCYQEMLYSCREVDFPLLLTSSQSSMLWEMVIQSDETGSVLLNVTETARLADEAWQLMHAWRLSDDFKQYPLNEDTAAFSRWAESYQSHLAVKNQMDYVNLIDRVRQWVLKDLIPTPDDLICYGFDHFTPQQLELLHVLNDTKCHVWLARLQTTEQAEADYKEPAKVKRVCYTDTQDEIYHAAVWARSRLEANPDATIGIVIPSLTGCRSTVQRIFSEVMQPDVHESLPKSHQNPSLQMPFNISLGLPLQEYPLVDAALTVLTLVTKKIAYDHISGLIHSPFINGGESEFNAGALLEIKLRRYAAPEMTLKQFVLLLQRNNAESVCPVMTENFSALLAYCQQKASQQASHAVFAKVALEILKIVGFPGERTLASAEYQTLKKFHAVVDEVATLDRVTPQTNFTSFVKRLNHSVRKTLFQPQTPDVPIQILGVLEATGLWFDHLWVMGLSDEQWPLQYRPNPFLPYALQKKSNMPLGSAAAALAFSQRIKNNWLNSADEVVLSHPKFGDGADAQEIYPTAMIRSIPVCELDLPQFYSHRDLIMKTANLESIEDDHVRPVIKQEFGGGVSVIKDYAACPFRAWARHILTVGIIDEPYAGLNAMDRGILLHHVLAKVWEVLKTKQVLVNLEPDELESILLTAVSDAVFQIKQKRPFALSDRFLSIEQRRLLCLAGEWMDVERSREDFSVEAIEKKYAILVGRLKLHGRMDRLDRLDSGKLILLDYKTRRYKVDVLLGERPDEPQLLLYLVMASPPLVDTAGVAFASIKSGEMGFSGIVSEEGILPGVKSFDQNNACAEFASWENLIEEWNSVLIQLAEGFLSGNVQVAPKSYPETCRHCELQAFCRINERRGMTEERENTDE